jgi:hypothetical protein
VLEGNKELEKEIYAHALSGEFKVHAVGSRYTKLELMMIPVAAGSPDLFSLLVLCHQIYSH